MTTEIKAKPKCFAAVEKPTTNAERLELHLANFVHITGLPDVPLPPREVWGTVTTFPNPFTTILVTEGGETWIAARLQGESEKSFGHVVKILAPGGTKHLLTMPDYCVRAGGIYGQSLLRRLSNPDYDPADRGH